MAVVKLIRDREQVEIAVAAQSVVVIKPGTKPARKIHYTTDDAWRAFHAEVAKRSAAGFALDLDGVAVAADEPRTFTSFPELELAVVEDPGDQASWDVLADAWLDASDPRGECVHAERALRGLTNPDEFLARKRALADAEVMRATQFYGPLGADAHRVRVRFERGLVSSITLGVERCAPGRSTAELLAAVLASPFARSARSRSAFPSRTIRARTRCAHSIAGFRGSRR